MEKVTLMQTMWDVVALEVGRKRDEGLREGPWKPLIEPSKGRAKVEQFRNDLDGAWDVVSRAVEVHIDNDPLAIQEKMDGAEQGAGAPTLKKLYKKYDSLLCQQRQKLRDLRSGDKKTQVECEIRELDEKLEETFQEICKLKKIGRASCRERVLPTV